MGEIINEWLKKPLFVYSFGLFFLIYNSAHYFPSFEPLVFFSFLLGYCLVNYIIITLQRRLGFHRYGISWLIFIWTLILFDAPLLSYLSEYIDKSFIRLRYLAVFFVALYFLICLIRRRIDVNRILFINHIINVFVFILIGSTLLSGIIIWKHEEHHMANETNRNLPSLKIKNSKDIIWILLDEYASPSSLRSQFKFNDPLIDSLKAKDFFVFDSLRSRNDITIYSVNSLFNMDDSIPVSNYMYAADYLNKSSWIKELEGNGYRFISLEFMNIGKHSKLLELNIFPDNYIDQLMAGTIYVALIDKYNKNHSSFDQYNQKVIRKLNNEVQNNRSHPTFIWAHLLLPHPPFYRDAKGNTNKLIIDDVNSASASQISKQYIGYLTYGNSIVLKVLNKIPNWKNKIIIISGDHGARMIIGGDDPRRKNPFGAIYYPGMDKTELSKIKYMQQIPFHLH